MVYVPLVTLIWVIIPTYVILFAIFTTGIVGGICAPYGVYSSVATQKTMAFSLFFVTYFLPLLVMTFCYYRIVVALRSKVNSYVVIVL